MELSRQGDSGAERHRHRKEADATCFIYRDTESIGVRNQFVGSDGELCLFVDS